MCKEKLITGVTVKEQMRKAQIILNKEVLPKEKLFQERKRNGKLSLELERALKSNA